MTHAYPWPCGCKVSVGTTIPKEARVVCRKAELSGGKFEIATLCEEIGAELYRRLPGIEIQRVEASRKDFA